MFDLSKVQTRSNLIFKTTPVFENQSILWKTYRVIIQKKTNYDKINTFVALLRI